MAESTTLALSSRLESLRKKKLDIKQQNKKDLYKDLQRQRAESVKIRKAELDALKESTEDATNPTEKILSYTLEECEQWEEKKEERKKAKIRSSENNYGDLAEQVYLKEVLKINANKSEFTSNANKIITPSKYSVHKPSKEKINELSEEMKEAQKRAFERREKNIRRESGANSFINEKNRQFNMKVDREYKTPENK